MFTLLSIITSSICDRERHIVVVVPMDELAASHTVAVPPGMDECECTPKPWGWPPALVGVWADERLVVGSHSHRQCMWAGSIDPPVNSIGKSRWHNVRQHQILVPQYHCWFRIGNCSCRPLSDHWWSYVFRHERQRCWHHHLDHLHRVEEHRTAHWQQVEH